MDNKNLYNDKELWEEADLNWYDYGFRNYDQQIGRFPQLDPLTDDYPYYTSYQYAGNEPIANVDIDGLEPGKVIIGGVAHGVVGSGGSLFGGIGSTLNSAASSLSSLSLNIGVNAAKITTNVINDKLRQSGIATQSSKCHPDNTYIKKDFERIQNEYSKLDSENGQVDFPRNKLWDIIDGGRDYNGWVVNSKGYKTNSRTPITGTPPDFGFGKLRGAKGLLDAINKARRLNRTRSLWSLTKEGASTIKYHKTFGIFYKSKSDNLWWAVDKAGHGGSKFKVFKESNSSLEWLKDADQYGDFISNKHKGLTGKFISWAELGPVK